MNRLVLHKKSLVALFALFSAGYTALPPYASAVVRNSNIYLASAATGSHQIFYAYSGDIQKPGLLFIHGTPGSWQAFDRYLDNPKLQENYFMVSVDRLGWGRSVLTRTDPEQALANKKVVEFLPQANSISAVMSRYPDKKWLLIGHSLGASIAPKVALLEPDRVSGLLLLAGSLSPKLGKARWYNLAASMLLIKWLLPANLKYSNDEIMVLKAELETLESELAITQLQTDVVVMQGLKDKLVSPDNAAYVKREWAKTFTKLRTIELPNAGHFLPWQQSDLVIDAIESFELE
jgi:pimeloyl-ACP methyl ester carboxylesterase